MGRRSDAGTTVDEQSWTAPWSPPPLYRVASTVCCERKRQYLVMWAGGAGKQVWIGHDQLAGGVLLREWEGLDGPIVCHEDGGPRSKRKAAKRVAKARWTRDEDARLASVINRHGSENQGKGAEPSSTSYNWARLAQLTELPGRNGKMCRERWFHYLSPAVSKEIMSDAENRALLAAVAEHGPRWATLQKMFQGRTDMGLKNRWNSNVRKYFRALQRAPPAGSSPGIAALRALDASALARHMLDEGVEGLGGGEESDYEMIE